MVGENKSTTVQLEEAIGTGQLLGLIYMGGSQPGAFRRLLPLEVEGNQLRARCYSSNLVKTFAIDKIKIIPDEIAELGSYHSTWSTKRSANPRFSSIKEVGEHFRSQLEMKGWSLTIQECDNDVHLELREWQKNGRVRKHPSIVLSFEELAYDLGVTIDGGTERINIRHRTRPWCLRSPKKTSSWAHLDKAVDAFIEAVPLDVDFANTCRDKPACP